MNNGTTKTLEKCKKNIESWYDVERPNIQVNIASRALYKYSGQMRRKEIRSNKARAHEFSLQNTGGMDYQINYGSFGLNGNGFLNNAFSSQGRTLEDLIEHFHIPVYQNFVGALHNSIMGGLTKSQISITVEAQDDFFNKEYENLQIDSLLERFSGSGQEQIVQQQAEKIKKGEDNADKSLNIFCSLIENSINKFFVNTYNKDALMSALDNLFTMGYSVLKLHIVEDKMGNDEIALDLIENPEYCFFSPLAQLKDKSDGMFAGIIKIVDKKQIEIWYKDKISSSGIKLDVLSDFNVTLPFNIKINMSKNHLVIVEYYEKVMVKNKQRIKMIVACGNLIFEESIVDEYTDLPLIYLNSSFGSKHETSSIFAQCLPIQKSFNELKYKINKMIPTLCTSKLLVPIGKSVAEFDALSNGLYSEAPAIGYSMDVGENASFAPTTLPGVDLPANALGLLSQFLQELEYITEGLMAGNITKGSETSGVVSGSSRQQYALNKNNLFAGRLNCFINGLHKICDVFCNMFYKIYSKSKNITYRMLKEIDETTYLNILMHSEINVDIEANTSAIKELNRQSMIELLQLNPDPILFQIIFLEFCKNLEIQNKGELISLIQEAMQIIAQKSQKPQEDPRTQIEMLKIQSEQQENDKQREFDAIENQKNRLARLEEKVIDGEFKVADAQLKHHETLTTQQNTMAHQITLQSLQDALRVTNNKTPEVIESSEIMY